MVDIVNRKGRYNDGSLFSFERFAMDRDSCRFSIRQGFSGADPAKFKGRGGGGGGPHRSNPNQATNGVGKKKYFSTKKTGGVGAIPLSNRSKILH